MRARARKCTLAGTNKGPPVFVDEFSGAAQYRQLDLRFALAAQHRDSVLAGFHDLHPGRGTVHPVIEIASLPGDAQSHPAFEQANDFVRLKIDDGVVVGVERTPVGKEDLDSSGLRSHAVASEERH